MKSTLTLSPAEFVRRMNRRSGVRIVALSVMLTALVAAGLIAGLRSSQAQTNAPQPDYSQVNDFLNGQKHIIRNDDLIINFAIVNFADDTTDFTNYAGSFSASTLDSQLTIHPIPAVPDGTSGCPSPCQYYWDPFFYKPDEDRNNGIWPRGLAMGQATGRFFNTDRDTFVQFPVLLAGGNEAPLLVSLTGDENGALSWQRFQVVSDVVGAATFIAGVGDFNGDGYDDLLMGYSQGNKPATFRIAVAVDINSPPGGFRLGPEFSPNAYGIREMTVGDFNGDGRSDFASIYVDPNQALYLATYSVDPQTLNISNGGNVQLNIYQGQVQPADFTYIPITMTAGRFTSEPHQQLIIGSQWQEGSNLYLQSVDFDPASSQPLTPLLKYTEQTVTGSDVAFKLKAGRLNWAGAADQLVWMSSSNGLGTTVQVITVDPANLTYRVVSQLSGDGQIPPDGDPFGNPRSFWGQDIAIGNFDHQQQSATNPNERDRDPDLQIALLGINVVPTGSINTDARGGVLYIYDFGGANPASPQLSQTSRTSLVATLFNIAGNDQDFKHMLGMTLSAGDLQGRSYRLGAGTKITVGTSQPTIIVAAPPMHADYIPLTTGTAPDVFNLSVVPDGYFSKYEVDTSSSTSSTDTNTTSWSFGAKETIGTSVAIGDEDEGDGATIKDTFTANQDLKGASETANGTFQSQPFIITQQTGFTDQLWIKETDFYIYTYPVIGRTVCPANTPNCDQPVPLTVQFSAPAPAEIKTPSASNIEWYQPPWEYGNIFSYPASYTQLQAYLTDIDLLSGDLTFYTDASAITVKNSWVSGSTTSQTVSFDQNYSFDNDLSVSGTVGLEDIATVNVNFGLDLSGSYGLSKLNQSTTSLEAATGISVQKPGTFVEPASYAYAVKPFIFGQQRPSDVTNTDPLTANINTYGLLRTAFVADPTDDAAGAWWSQAYADAPDIAVNHPNRWTVSAPGLSNPIPNNCRPTGTGTMNCVALQQSAPANPWQSNVHFMRGFFISSAHYPGQGPQLTTATAGNELTLQTRVYNYSLTPMPDGTTVHVRFYGIPWNQQTQRPAGLSFQIGKELSLSPIPAFSAMPEAPFNWITATSDNFDTTPYSNQYLTFFVVVWMQKADGTLAQETTGHGLNALPGTINSFEDAANLEEVLSGGTRSYSNNIGFYNSVFYVFPIQTGTAAAVTSAPAPALAPKALAPKAEMPELKMGQVQLSAKSTEQGQPVEVSVLFETGDQPINNLSVDFYDGDPAAGGRIFDIERLPHIRANDAFLVKVNFRSNACGSDPIFVKAGVGKPYAVTGQSQPVRVECLPKKPKH